MRYMLQVIGFTDAQFADGEGPTAEEFMAWEQALRDAGVRVGQNPTEAGQHMVDIVRELGL